MKKNLILRILASVLACTTVVLLLLELVGVCDCPWYVSSPVQSAFLLCCGLLAENKNHAFAFYLLAGIRILPLLYGLLR